MRVNRTIQYPQREPQHTEYEIGSFPFRISVMAIFTLEDEQIVWTDKSSQTDKSSDVKTGRTNFKTTLSPEFVRLFVRL